MIESSHPQGSAAWDLEHLGIVTSRHVGRLVTNSWRASGPATSEKLLRELLAEWATGQPWADFKGTVWMERGEALEAEAVDYYQALREHSDARRPGLIYRDDSRLCGTSPDWLIESDGEAEVKCCASPQHIASVLCCADGICPPDYLRQVQYHLWVTGRRWCDFLAYSDAIDAQGLIRVEPDADAFKAFDKLIPRFLARIEAGRERLAELGISRP